MSRPYNSNERENRTMQKNITLIYGDCSSPEIVTQAVRVLDKIAARHGHTCLLYTSPSPRDQSTSRMPSSA